MQIVFILLAMTLSLNQAFGQCQAGWLTGHHQGMPGINGQALASLVWDPDGAGPVLQRLVIGGDFTVAAATSALRIATWDGGQWSVMGQGFNGTVHALVLFNGEVFAGGEFTASGSSPIARVARWNGQEWVPLGIGVDNIVRALCVYNSELYACGNFTMAGGQPAAGIARWNGSSWQALGPAFASFSTPRCMTVYSGQLVVGGSFFSVGGVSASNIVRWTGSAWQAFGSGTTGTINAVAVLGFDLYAAGDFMTAGGIQAIRIARWNGTAWSALSSGLNAAVDALHVHNGALWAGGSFSLAGGNAAQRIAFWSGGAWQTLIPGLYGPVRTIAAYQNEVIAGGSFGSFTPFAANGIARWDGFDWLPLSPSVSDDVLAATVFEDKLILGGYMRSAGMTRVNGLAAWDGSRWSSFGEGIGYVSAVGVFNGQLYASSTEWAHWRLARWNGSSWEGCDYPGAGATAMTVLNGLFLVADEVHSPSNVAKVWAYDGTTWQQMGGNFIGGYGFVDAFAEYGGELYAGGGFTHVNNVPISNIAKWNGADWEQVGGGVTGFFVGALALYDNALIAGGEFHQAGGVSAQSMARWDGVSWQPFPGVSTSVRTLFTSNGFLYAGGASNSALNRLVRWDGAAWLSMGAGLGVTTDFTSVSKVLAFRGEIVAVGGFFGGEGNPDSYWARWTETGVPVITAHPRSTTVQATFDAVFHSTAAGYSSLSHQWRRNGVPIIDGPTGAGSTYSGAQTATLTITRAHPSDGGGFDCLITSPCGNASSASAQLTVSCYANCDQSTSAPVLTANDFVCFIINYNLASPYANCDGSTGAPVLSANDFLCFLTAYAAGCQ